MILSTVTEMLAAATVQGGQAAGQSGGPPPWGNLVFVFLPFMVVLYFIMIRPQQKRAKEHAQMVKSLHSGDRVVTSGGILGVVITVKDKTVNIRSADAKFEVTKAAIAEVIERGGESTSES